MQTFTIPLTDSVFPAQPSGQLIVIYEDDTIISVAHEHDEGTKRLLSLAMLQSSMFEQVWQELRSAMRTHAVDAAGIADLNTDNHSHLLINPS